MRILMLATDRRVFEEGSGVRSRMVDYGTIVDELTILVFGAQKPIQENLSPNVSVVGIVGKNPFRIWSAIKTKAQEGTYDLITAMDPFEVGFFALRIGKKLGLPVELQIHTDIFSRHFANESYRRVFQQILSRFTLPKASCIRVASERIGADLRAGGISVPFRVLPISVDAVAIANHEISTDLHAHYPEFSKIVLSLSRLSPEKNIAGIIRAFKTVSLNVPNAGLVIVGSGTEEPALRTLVRQIGLGASVIFDSWTKDPYSYMKTADVFVSNSLYEGYGMSIIEAAILGKPIVSTAVGVIGYEIAADSVEVVPFNDDQALAGGLIRALGATPKKPVFTKPLSSKQEYLQGLQSAWKACGTN